MLSDEEIASAECAHLSAHAQFVGAGEVWIEGASDFARAIESAATAPLLARIAELERELEEARKDAELLDWMIFYSARVRHSNDAEYCEVVWRGDEGERRTRPFGDAREAIRAAIKEQT